jgi:hypothetical protein
MAMIDRNFTFATNGTVSAADLHNLIDSATIYQDLITGQLPITSVGTNYELLIADGTNPNAAPNAVTVYDLFEDALTAGTYTNANISAALTYGTATGTRLVSTNATITTGTITTAVIPTLTAGTTTSTAATITSGTITNLASTTGTIGNLSTTLAGDFTISQGTGTLGTTGATLGTYGGSTSIPVLAINAKGQVTSTGTAAITSGLTGFRNRIFNGDMRIDQRNGGASATINNSTKTYTVDRWQANGQPSDGVFTVQQSSTAPAGFTNSVILTVTTADSSIATGQYYLFCQRIEGYNVADFDFGKSTAKTITISFWVRSSITGQFGGAIQNSANDRSYPFTYSIISANTFEYKTITIAGDTSGTWLTDNGIGLFLWLDLGCSTTVRATAGSWASGTYYGATGDTNWISTLGATFYITGVQLEQGSTATEFERRPIGTELAMCQRYFWMIATGNNKLIGSGYNFTATNMQMTIQHLVTMRTAPTIYQATGTGYYTFERNGGSDAFNSLALGSATTDQVSISFNSTEISGTAGQAGNVFLSNASAYVGLSAEL